LGVVYSMNGAVTFPWSLVCGHPKEKNDAQNFLLRREQNPRWGETAVL